MEWVGWDNGCGIDWAKRDVRNTLIYVIEKDMQKHHDEDENE